MKLSSIFPHGAGVRLMALGAISLMAILLAAGSAKACSYAGAQQVFKPWGDSRNYVLGPDGGFEAGAQGWTLSGGASPVSGNESYYLNGRTDSQSLYLPGGSSVISPGVCMSLDTPVFRMFARNTGDPSSRLRVEATYKLLGLVRTKTVSTVAASSDWAPTQQMSTVLTLSTIVGTLIPSAIQIKITALDSKGQWQVDDLYIDPFARR
jgi:hypothetical protein